MRGSQGSMSGSVDAGTATALSGAVCMHQGLGRGKEDGHPDASPEEQQI